MWGGVASCPCGAKAATRMVHLGSRYYGINVKICLEFLVMVKRGMVI